MLIEWLYEILNNINNHGIRWGLTLSLYGLFRKERRNILLDKRDESIFHNQRIIMEKLGVLDKWHGPVRISSWDQPNYKKSFSLLRKEIQQVYQKRRETKMNQNNINWITLLTSLFGAIKLILQPFGVDLSHVTDAQVNDMTNGVAALLVVGGIIYNHFKKNVTVTTQPVQSDPNKFITG